MKKPQRPGFRSCPDPLTSAGLAHKLREPQFPIPSIKMIIPTQRCLVFQNEMGKTVSADCNALAPRSRDLITRDLI